MIQSFFVWLLGPDVAVVFFIMIVGLVIFGIGAIVTYAEEIVKWWQKRNKKLERLD